MKRALNVAIVGYGIAGIAAAVHLRRTGHAITHFERQCPPAAHGAGMLLHPAALRQLDRLGVLAAALEIGAPVRRICAQTMDGRSLMDLRYGDVVAGKHGLGIQRGALHWLLAGADTGREQVHAGCSIVTVDAESGWLVDEHELRHGPFDLIVVADGTHSRLREQIGAGAGQHPPAGAAALVGLFDAPEQFAQQRLAQYFDGTRHLSIWPVGRAGAGEPFRCSLALNVSMSEAASLQGAHHGAEWLARLSPRLRAVLGDRAAPMKLRVISYRDIELQRCCAGRAVLIGDAGHSMSPQLGTGAQLALEDAAVLADTLDSHHEVPAALHSFMQIRMPRLQRYHFASRWMTSVLQSDNRALALVRDQLFGRMMAFSPARRMALELLA
jgi:FAD-dependent urate hydroxylase